MSVRAMAIVWASSLDPYDRLVMLALADSANDDGVCWPSVPKLAKKCGMTDRGVQKVMDRLEPYINRNFRVNTSTMYRLKLEHLPRVCDRGEHGSPVNGVHHSGEPGTPEGVNGVRGNHKKEPKRKRQKIDTGLIADDWKPTLGPETETAQETAKWPKRFLAQQLEAFIAHHQSKGTKSKNFNLQWKTWALGEFAKRALKGWSDERSSEGGSRNEFAVAAASFAARHRVGACPD